MSTSYDTKDAILRKKKKKSWIQWLLGMKLQKFQEMSLDSKVTVMLVIKCYMCLMEQFLLFWTLTSPNEVVINRRWKLLRLETRGLLAKKPPRSPPAYPLLTSAALPWHFFPYVAEIWLLAISQLINEDLCCIGNECVPAETWSSSWPRWVLFRWLLFPLWLVSLV